MLLTAADRAVSPSLLTTVIFAPRYSSIATISPLPLPAAYIKGVRPALLAAFTLDPAYSNVETISKWSPLAAYIKAVSPALFTAFKLAPAYSNATTLLTLPLVADCIIFEPSLQVTCISDLACSNVATMSDLS